MGIKLFLLMGLFLAEYTFITNNKVYSWKTTKTKLKEHIGNTFNPKTLYGGCVINSDFTVDLDSCHYYFRGIKKDKGKIDIEHVVTSSRMMEYLKCNGTRYSCRHTSYKFKECHNNMNNLFPSVSTINRFRGNMEFKNLKDSEVYYPFGKEIGLRKHIKLRYIEPVDSVKPIIARVYKIMDKMECIRLSEEEMKQYEEWSIIGEE